MHRRGWLGSWLAGSFWTSVQKDTVSADPTHFKRLTLSGHVQYVSRILADRNLPADAEHFAKQVALIDPDQAVWPILCDEASRALILDERLHGRDVQLSVRKYQGLPWVQVVGLTIDHEGRMAIPEYYCDVCTITVRYPQVCPCCQGPMELRYRQQNPASRVARDPLENRSNIRHAEEP